MEIDYSSIAPGDFVTIVFKHSDDLVGNYTISGKVHGSTSALWVGGRHFTTDDGSLKSDVVEITEHRAKEPEVGFFGVDDDGIYWARTKDHGWMSIWPTTNVDNVEYGYTWEQVVSQLDGRGLMAVTA